MADVSMPRLSDSMEEGTILKWLKSDGDSVAKGEELVEIETDKANMTYEADEEGTLEIVAQEGDTLPVGETIARIGEGSGGGSSDEADSETDAEDEAEAQGNQAESEAEADAKGDDDHADGEDDAQAAAEDEAESGDDADTKGDEAPAAEGQNEAAGNGDDETAAEGQDDAADESDDHAEAEDDGGAGAEAGGKADDEPEGKGDDETAAEGQDDAAGKRGDEPEGEGDGGAGGKDGGAAPRSAGGAAERGGADGSNGRVKASPIARRMAREMGLELAGVRGTGPGGRIVKADVEAAARGGSEERAAPAKDEKAPAPAGDSGRGETTHQDLTRLQRTVARRMAESKATAPDFVISLEVDMEEAVALRKQLKVAADGRPAPSFNDFVVKASALALRDFPRANAAYRDGAFELYSRVNVGVAVAGQDALVVPTVFDADKKGLGTIAAEARALAEKVREGKITPPELSAGTFTVSNLGMYGIRRFVAVINPPQAAILAVGELTPRPVVRDGEVVVRVIMELTLSCDHRILYGADAAAFLARIREYLETPLKLVL